MPTSLTLDELAESGRHEMRHTFWNAIQRVVFRTDPLSSQCINVTDKSSRDMYAAALAKDRDNIKKHKELLLGTSTLSRQQKNELAIAQKDLKTQWSKYKHKAAYPLTSKVGTGSCPPVGALINLPAPNLLFSEVHVKDCIATKAPDPPGKYWIICSFNDVIKDALQIILDIENTTLKPYPADKRLYERDAHLHGKLPSFIIEFFYPNLTALLKKIASPLLNYLSSPTLTAWPQYIRDQDAAKAITHCTEAARFLAHAEIDIMLAENSIFAVLNDIEKRRLNSPGTIYVLNYIIRKTTNDLPNQKKANTLLAKAWAAKYQNAGLIDSFTGMTQLYLKEACQSYLSVYHRDRDALTPDDYLICLPLLRRNNSPHYKEVRQKALAACRRDLECELAGSSNWCELQNQYNRLSEMPPY